MSDNLLDPTNNGFVAGILHRNSVAVAQEGPWHFIGVEYADEQDSDDGETDINGFTSVSFGSGMRCKRGGTCYVCSAAIVNIVRAKNAAGKVITLGCDCAETLLKNQDALKLKAAVAKHDKTKRAAAKERAAVRNRAKFAGAKEQADKLGQLDGFAGTFGRSVSRQIQAGKALSAKQLALLDKLIAEIAED